jgi:hypothetical protein
MVKCTFDKGKISVRVTKESILLYQIIYFYMYLLVFNKIYNVK